MFIGSRMMMKPSTISDPYFSNVVLLMHMDGANGGAIFTDSSSFSRAMTANGGATTSSAKVKFGTASFASNGSTTFVTTPTSSDFAFGTGDFTIEAWCFITGGVENDVVGTQYAPGFLAKFGSAGMFIWVAGVNKTISLSVPSLNTWHHCVWERSAGVIYYAIDGVLYTGPASTESIAAGSLPLAVSSYNDGTGEFFNGYIDDLRITNGIARYTSNFTPPTAPFPNS